jgi:asparagine synthase (glutamine-hydrolysing)
MFRYFALSWEPADKQASSAASLIRSHFLSREMGWAVHDICSGYVLLYAGTAPNAWQVLPLTGQPGAVVGSLFSRTANAGLDSPVSAFDAAASLRIVRSSGRELIDRYWGRYIAFLRHTENGRPIVIRDPQGWLPCFITAHCGVRLVFSDLNDCLSLGICRFTTNWHFVRSYLCAPGVLARGTGLNEVQELVPGEQVILEGETLRYSSLWTPSAIAQDNPLEDFDQAAQETRRVTLSCISAWARCYPRIVMLASGGLDSSIVLHGLKQAACSPAVRCLTYYYPDSAVEDERAYARLASRHADCELVEAAESTGATPFESLPKIHCSAKPGNYQALLRHGAVEARVAREFGASAIFCGVGGDQIFFQLAGSLSPAADFIRHRGVRTGLGSIVLGLAESQRVSALAVIAFALRHALSRDIGDPLETALRFQRLTHPDIIAAVLDDRRYIHPWLSNLRALPPGKRMHVGNIVFANDPYEAIHFPGRPDVMAPLVSQPLIELMLRTPTYILAHNGVDRATARAAFEASLPDGILRRVAKGGMNKLVFDLFRKQLGFLRQFMLDGVLVNEGLLSRPRIEDVFTRASQDLLPEIVEIVCLHVSTEAWLRRVSESLLRIP